MDWNDFRTAFNEAQRTIRIANNHVDDMARMVAGRLRASGVNTSSLVALKKELASFNMHTKEWAE